MRIGVLTLNKKSPSIRRGFGVLSLVKRIARFENWRLNIFLLLLTVLGALVATELFILTHTVLYYDGWVVATVIAVGIKWKRLRLL